MSSIRSDTQYYHTFWCPLNRGRFREPKFSLDEIYLEIKAVHGRVLGLGHVLTFTDVTDGHELEEISAAFRGTGQALLQECRHLEAMLPMISEHAV